MIQDLKKSIIALSAVALLSNSVFAEDQKKNMEISVNPIMMALGYLPLTYRIALTEKMALGVNAYGHFFSLGDTKVHGLGIGVSTKFFLSGTAISDSWYVQPQVNFGYEKFTEKGVWALSPSAIVGYTWVWDSGFLINLGGGLQYKGAFVGSSFWKDKKGTFNHGLAPAAEFSLGWAF